MMPTQARKVDSTEKTSWSFLATSFRDSLRGFFSFFCKATGSSVETSRHLNAAIQIIGTVMMQTNRVPMK